MVRWKILYCVFMAGLAAYGEYNCLECTPNEQWVYFLGYISGSAILWFTFFGKEVPIGIWVSRENKWALGWSAFLGIAIILGSLSWMVRGEPF